MSFLATIPRVSKSFYKSLVNTENNFCSKVIITILNKCSASACEPGGGVFPYISHIGM